MEIKSLLVVILLVAVAAAQPANFNCNTSFFAGPTGVNTTFTTVNVTTGSNPTQCGSNNNPVWFYYDVSAFGYLTIEITSFPLDTVVNVWRGPNCDSLTPVGCDDDGGVGTLSKITVPLNVSVRYYFTVGGYSSSSYGTGTYQLTFVANSSVVTGSTSTPVTTGSSGDANQVCAGSVLLTMLNNNYSISNVNSYSGSVTPTQGCSSYNPVWYYYVSTFTGNLHLEVTSFTADTTMNVYRGTSCAALTPLGCNDDGGVGFLSAIDVAVSIGDTIYFNVASYSSSSRGTGTVQLSIGVPTSTTGASSTTSPASTTGVAPVANQVCSGAIASQTLAVNFTVSNQGSYSGAVTPTITCGGYNPVWYFYDPTVSGYLQIEVTTFTADTILNVYRGASCAALTNLACDDDGGQGTLSLAIVPITMGVRIYYNVASYSSTARGSGTVALTYYTFPPSTTGQPPAPVTTAAPATTGSTTSPIPVPGNAVCTGAVAAALGNNTFSTVGSPYTLASQCGAGSNPTTTSPVWFYFNPTAAGNLTIEVLSFNSGTNSIDSLLNLYQGTTCNNSVPVGCDDDSGQGTLSKFTLSFTNLNRIYFNIGSYSSSGATGSGLYRVTYTAGSATTSAPVTGAAETSRVSIALAFAMIFFTIFGLNY